PALPWFFQELFARSSAEARLAARRAFVEAVGELGNSYWGSYQAGKREVLSALRAEEANLLQARRLALENRWWGGVISAMQGLDVLYSHTGCRAGRSSGAWPWTTASAWPGRSETSPRRSAFSC